MKGTKGSVKRSGNGKKMKKMKWEWNKNERNEGYCKGMKKTKE